MPFAIVVDGQATEIAPDAEFITTRLRVQPDDAEHYGVRAGKVIDQVIRHAPGAVLGLTEADLERYCIETFEEPAPPAGKELATRMLKVSKAGKVSVEVTWRDIPEEPGAAAPPIH